MISGDCGEEGGWGSCPAKEAPPQDVFGTVIESATQALRYKTRPESTIDLLDAPTASAMVLRLTQEPRTERAVFARLERKLKALIYEIPFLTYLMRWMGLLRLAWWKLGRKLGILRCILDL